MFAPENYTPLAQLWDQFIEARCLEFCKHSLNYYRTEGFNAALLRGGPLDIAEYVFLREMSRRGVYVASVDGRKFRLYSSSHSGVRGLFSKVDPYSSSMLAAGSAIEHGSDVEVKRVAGSSFEPWEYEPENEDAWLIHYKGLFTLLIWIERTLPA
ncbi:MAG: hypothetical protein ABJO27_23480 [Pseudoruegeria sp.]